MTRALLGVLLLVLLCGCDSGTEQNAQWEDYLARLSRVLDRPVPAANQPAYPHLPRQRELTLEFSQSDINLLDFLRLRRCKLRETLAERNSILGRHGDASAQLMFDLRFLSEAPACIALLKDEGEEELAAVLRSVHDSKQQQLPARLFMTLMAGPEFREIWQPPQSARAYPPDKADPAIAALQQWQRWQQAWLAGDWHHDSQRVLTVLGQLRHARGGEMLAFQRAALAGLRRSTELVEQRVNGRPLCLNAQPVKAANYFQNVVNQRFVAGIQRRAAKANRHQNQLMGVVRDIESTVLIAMASNNIAIPLAYRQWQARRDHLLDRAIAAYRHHVDVVGQLLSQCGLSPGNR